MKEYDIKAHLPGQVERFLNGLTLGPEAQLQIENSIEIIKALLQDDKFNNGLKDYKKQLDAKVDQLEKEAIAKIKNNPEVNSIDKVMNILNSCYAENDEVNADYIKALQNYILGYIDQLGDNAADGE